MPDDWLFEIPVYRVDFSTWAAHTQARVQRATSEFLAPSMERGRTPTDFQRRRAVSVAEYTERPHGWYYNEVVGWIRLLWDGPYPVVKGYLWRVGKKSIDGGRPRHRYQRGFIAFPFVGGYPTTKVLEEWFDAKDSDAQVFHRLRSALTAVTARGGELAGRHIDLSAFDFTGPHVRWRDLLRVT